MNRCSGPASSDAPLHISWLACWGRCRFTHCTRSCWKPFGVWRRSDKIHVATLPSTHDIAPQRHPYNETCPAISNASKSCNDFFFRNRLLVVVETTPWTTNGVQITMATVVPPSWLIIVPCQYHQVENPQELCDFDLLCLSFHTSSRSKEIS